MGVVVGYWLGTQRASIRLPDGRVVDLEGAEEVGVAVKAGDEVIVDLDEGGRPTWWRGVP